VKGNVIVDTGTVITSGWLEGVTGKFTLKGTLNNTHSEYCAALLGQLDVSAATALTAGALSMLWLDAGGSAVSASILNAVQAITITNSTQSALQSVLWVDANATYFMFLDDRGSGWLDSSAIGTYSKRLKVHVNGTTYYIPLYLVS